MTATSPAARPDTVVSQPSRAPRPPSLAVSLAGGTLAPWLRLEFAEDLTAAQAAACCQLSRRSEGSMTEDLMTARALARAGVIMQTAQTLRLLDPFAPGPRLLAWALLVRDVGDGCVFLHVYVRASQRRQGHGSLLLQHAQNLLDEPLTVFPDTQLAGAFYSQFPGLRYGL